MKVCLTPVVKMPNFKVAHIMIIKFGNNGLDFKLAVHLLSTFFVLNLASVTDFIYLYIYFNSLILYFLTHLHLIALIIIFLKKVLHGGDIFV